MKSLVAALVLLSAPAFANDTQTWEGQGTAYTPAGQALGSYEVKVVNTTIAPGVIESVATSTADGKAHVITQKLTIKGSKWSDESNLGHGGGSCYGADLCENYIAGANGMAYATTIVKDGADHQRQMTVVLKNGRAVKVLRQDVARSR